MRNNLNAPVSYYHEYSQHIGLIRLIGPNYIPRPNSRHLAREVYGGVVRVVSVWGDGAR